MSEFLEVDFGAEEIQNEIKNHNKTEEVKEANSEHMMERKNDKETKQKKSPLAESEKKDPTFFVLKLDEHSLCSSLISKQLSIPVDLYRMYEKYLEVII